MLQINIQDVFFQHAVKTRSLLPLEGNSLKDARYVKDVGAFFMWSIDKSYGNISCWVEVIF
jgi:hypothetical protein